MNLERAVSLIKKFEGFKSVASIDTDNFSVGYGENFYPDGKAVKQGDTITEEQASANVFAHATAILKDIEALLQVEQTESQKTALIDFVYQFGKGNFLSSTLLKKINSRAPIDEITNEFERWIYVKGIPNNGLINRRHEEKLIYLETPEEAAAAEVKKNGLNIYVILLIISAVVTIFIYLYKKTKK